MAARQEVSEADAPTGELSGSVYIWRTPLTLPPLVPASLAQALPQHAVVIADCADGGCAAFDFEPADKASPLVALRLLAGGAAPGAFGARRLRRAPAGAERLGPAAPGAAVRDVTGILNRDFDPNLSLSANDCNRYARSVLGAIMAKPEEAAVAPDARSEGCEIEPKEGSLLGAVALVAGTTVGAGILALPAVTQPVGFVPSTLGLLLCWVYMATTGLLIAEVALADMASSGKVATSLQSMAARTIGPAGAVVSSLFFIIVHFGLLVAYLSRGGELLAAALPAGLALPGILPAPAAFALLFGGGIFATKGSDALESANNVFTLVVLGSFAALVGLAVPAAEPARLVQTADWDHLTEIAPTLLLSLVYHNVVPTICGQLNGNRGNITAAIVWGSFLPLLMFVAWNGVILAAVPPGGIGGDPLDALRQSGGAALAAGVLAFSLSAIVTSFTGFVVALTDFFADALRPAAPPAPGGGVPGGAASGGSAADGASQPLASKVRDFSLTLLPPLAVACYDPTVFFTALDKAGAFGVSLLFGFLPAWMALAHRLAGSPVPAPQACVFADGTDAPLAPGGFVTLALVAGGAVAIVAQNALELLGK